MPITETAHPTREPAFLVNADDGLEKGTVANPLVISGALTNAAIGTTADAAVTDPTVVTSAATLIALVKGWLTGLGAVADSAWTTGSGSVIALLKAVAGRLPAALGRTTSAASLAVVESSDSIIRSRFFSAAASAMTRPANTTAYTAADAVSNNATAGSVTAISFSLSDTNDDPVAIEGGRVVSTDTGPGTAGATFELWLFNSDPTASTGVSGGDNAAFSQKQAGFIGKMTGTFFAASDGSIAELSPSSVARILAAPVSGAKTVFGLLKTLTAFTPSANSTTFTATLTGYQGRV